MKPAATEIEVEVLEIDGAAPPAPLPQAETSPDAPWQDWRRWPTQIRRLDSRWWPLWLVLAIVALVLLVTVGVAFGLVLLIYRTLRNLVRAVFS